MQGSPVKQITNKTYELLIVDDHQMIRKGLGVLLKSKRGVMDFNIYEAESSEEALMKVEGQFFDIVLLDYDIPEVGGAQATASILKISPKTKVLAISVYSDLPYIDEMIGAGAKGYLIKDVETGELLRAIRKVLSGGVYFSQEAAAVLLEAGRRVPNGVKSQKHLTPKESQVVQLIADGWSSAEIATKLSISKRTVETHRQNIAAKLHAKNTAGIIKVAYNLGILPRIYR